MTGPRRVRLVVREGVCPHGWQHRGEGCDYTDGHYCNRDANHAGRCRCVCGATTTTLPTPETP